MTSPISVRCPVCAAAVPWNESSRFRPFCSERCRTIDLGDWAAERHRITGAPVDEEAPPPQEPSG
jgi:endogenous inhibitor of DNA gyrase (YacG/DUF329 family)